MIMYNFKLEHASDNRWLHAELALPTNRTFHYCIDAVLAENVVAAGTFNGEYGQAETDWADQSFLIGGRCHSTITNFCIL